MSLPPNRLIDWLPLLLFACSTPALAAQSWTTVWTPGGAPTIQATGGGGTHDSKTNCRPCEVWDVYKNSGQGGWDPLPAGTEPIQCAGDTNDYTCMMCDGMGIVTNRPNNTPVDAGDGCGCCKDGKPWAPEPDCKNPMNVNFTMHHVGPCPCEDGEIGCTVHAGAFIIYDACFDKCEWKPSNAKIIVGYLQSTCSNQCQTTVTTNDVNKDNYCSILAALNERIAKETKWAEDPPPPPTSGSTKPPEPVCFGECIINHEDKHVEQLKELWESKVADMQKELGDISIQFNCDDAKSASDATAKMNEQVNTALTKIKNAVGQEYMNSWLIEEQNAYQASLECLQNLLAQIQALALADCQ